MERTLLLLGAGVSLPYGFPAGEQLTKRIVEVCKNPIDEIFKLIQQFHFSDEFITQFATDLDQSAYSSIDIFLANRPDYINIGRVAIAGILIPHEDPDMLGPRADGGCYRVVWERIAPFFDDPTTLPLTILTLNYDRSLEQFLFKAAQAGKGASEQDAAAFVRALDIRHIHGQLGDWKPRHECYVSGAGRGYHCRLAPADIDESRRSIRVISQIEHSDEAYVAARERIEESVHIAALGFAYHPEIATGLRFDHLTSDQFVFGTTYGLTKGQRHSAGGLTGQAILELGESGEDAYRSCSTTRYFLAPDHSTFAEDSVGPVPTAEERSLRKGGAARSCFWGARPSSTLNNYPDHRSSRGRSGPD